MKKSSLLIAVVAALAVAYPTAAWVTGKRLETKLSKLDGRDLLFSNFKVVKQTYTRGIFTSTQESTIELNTAGMSAKSALPTDSTMPGETKPLQMQIINHIQHGPVPGIFGIGAGKIDTEIVLDAASIAELKKVFGDKKFLEIRTVLNYTGGGNFRITSPAVKTTVGPNQDKLDWKGLRFDIGFDTNYKTLSFDFASPGAEIITANGSTTLKIGDIKLQGKAERAYPDGFIYLGDSKASINAISFVNTQAGNKGVQLKDLVIESSTHADHDLINSELKFGINSITMNDNLVGSVHYDYSLRNLHGPSTNQLFLELSRADLAKEDAAQLEEIQKKWKQYAIEILKHNPQIALDRLSLTGKNGEFKVSAKLGFVGVQAEDFDNPALLMTKIESKGQVSLSDGLVDDFIDASQSDPEARNMMRSMFYSQIETWETQGFLQREAKTYQSQFSWKDGQFLVNGKVFPAKPAGDAASNMPPPVAVPTK
ncbi:YdgA family protein [Undibacterium flavidum]|uniref:YdgA family protein n=1 Tax=Undibacterium flavidum TaxID=2762297 RepID=A0ABR6YH94_9BURK|nr:YdgA family protein [Undibacterium flavidum]MBC3875961.1 YdgA family protein [Undibacterium flavidum]